MRKIETQMIEAVNEALNWKSGNTEVKTDSANISRVFLHGNHIATVGDNFIQLFDGGWQTATTKSRLNAIIKTCGVVGEGIFQRAGEWFIRRHVDFKVDFEIVKFTSGIMV